MTLPIMTETSKGFHFLTAEFLFAFSSKVWQHRNFKWVNIEAVNNYFFITQQWAMEGDLTLLNTIKYKDIKWAWDGWREEKKRKTAVYFHTEKLHGYSALKNYHTPSSLLYFITLQLLPPWIYQIVQHKEWSNSHLKQTEMWQGGKDEMCIIL